MIDDPATALAWGMFKILMIPLPFYYGVIWLKNILNGTYGT